MHCSRYSAISQDATPWIRSHFTSIPRSISHQRYLPLFLAICRHNTAFVTYATVCLHQRHCTQDCLGLSCGHIFHHPEFVVFKTNDSKLGWKNEFYKHTCVYTPEVVLCVKWSTKINDDYWRGTLAVIAYSTPSLWRTAPQIRVSYMYIYIYIYIYICIYIYIYVYI